METEQTEPPGRRPDVCEPTQPCVVDVEDATRRMEPGKAAWVADRATVGANVLGCGGEVRVRVVGDADMIAAHEKHLNEATTTDVLTFDMADGAAAETRVLDADVLICLDEAERQASERGHAAHLEVLLYVVHAILHCLGFADHDEDAARAMHAREDEVLRAIGVGSVYAAPAQRADDGGRGEARA